MGEAAAVGSLLGGAASMGSLLFSNNDAAATQAQLAANAQQTARDQLRYQQALNAEAMKRAIAGIVDANGNTVAYDPGTNTWRTVLSDRGKMLQNSADNAQYLRNTTEFQRQLRANEGAERRGMAAESAANPILEAIKRYTATDPQALEGDLQQASTLAHRETFRPVIDSTLRSFARTGTAAGPALAAIGSKSMDSLRRSMIENVIRARTGATEIDNNRRGGMINDFTKLSAAATPGFNYTPIGDTGPATALTNAINNRANGASTAASYAAMGVPGATNASTAASKLGIDTVPNSNLLSAQLAGLGKMLTNNTQPMSDAITKLLSAGGGNQGDQVNPWTLPAPANYSGWFGTDGGW